MKKKYRIKKCRYYKTPAWVKNDFKMLVTKPHLRNILKDDDVAFIFKRAKIKIKRD